ncbi:MAG TPA: RsiV family protein, partial [Luteimonas sp.]|nr:RsiV family protein [Luteimonas sp.]
LVDSPRIVAVAADGASYTGGAHGNPLVARFVWLPERRALLTAAALIPGAEGWKVVSGHVREQLHAALSQRIDAEELDAAERAEVLRSAARMIDAGSEPEAGDFSQFEPLMGPGGTLRGLRFVFPPYQVGPYSDGLQTVEVPAAVLLPHVAPEYRGLFVAG